MPGSGSSWMTMLSWVWYLECYWIMAGNLSAFSYRFLPAPPAVKIFRFYILMFFLIWILLFSVLGAIWGGFGAHWLASEPGC